MDKGKRFHRMDDNMKKKSYPIIHQSNDKKDKTVLFKLAKIQNMKVLKVTGTEVGGNINQLKCSKKNLASVHQELKNSSYTSPQ